MDHSNERCYYEVEDILGHRQVDGKDQYLLKWKMWPSSYNNWEPLENLHCPELLRRYHEQVSATSSHPRMCTINGPEVAQKVAYPLFASDEAETFQKKMPFTNGSAKKCRDDNDRVYSNKNDLVMKSNNAEIKETKNRDAPYEAFVQDFDLAFGGGQWIYERLTHTKFIVEFCGPNNVGASLKNRMNSTHYRKLREWQNMMNYTCESKGIAAIMVENFVDDQGPPTNFHYILECIYRDGVTAPIEAPFGCQCTRNCLQSESCCPYLMDGEVAYTPRRTVHVGPGRPIYECNRNCRCTKSCGNRVVQKGRQVKVAIFRTADGRGWGVKTLDPISKGSFVMEYVGEVITNREAERRGNAYDNVEITYLFDLDFFGDPEFVIDARYYGNEAHFLNHSCDPNLQVYAVWVENYNPLCPRIAFFATRDIKKHEELCFDYMMTARRGSSKEQGEMIPCKCNSSKCRGSLLSKRTRRT